MNAKELRIGNWVRIKDVPTTNEWQVESIGSLQQVGGQLWSIEELEPIPLTEEWLERFGFDKDDDGVWELPSVMWSCEIEYGGSMTFKKLGLDILCPDILYVNQLQNLYFALSGEELTIKE
jgi:hypothetical protein